MRIALSLLTGLFLAAAACSSPALDDELAGEETGEGAEGKADGEGTYTYFHARADFRRCMSPLCGGMWVERANRSTTRCADGQYEDDCYVAEVDYSSLHLDETGLGEVHMAANAGKLLLRGKIKKKEYDDFGNLGVFVASEAWIGRGEGELDGVVARIEPLHIECITYPCASATERKLNSSARAQISGLDWSPSGASEETIAATLAALDGGAGLFVAGNRAWEQGPAGRGKLRTVTQFWTAPAKGETPADCIVSGCSGEICADEDMASICLYRPEYVCYETATCGRLEDGSCGWSGEGLAECLAQFADE
jgi:eight-cysteine-cluster-containing protein